MYQVQLSQSYFAAQLDEPVREETIGDLLRVRVALTPNAMALVESDITGTLGRQWTYAELLRDCERLARALLTRYRQGERIAVWAPNAPEWMLLEFASALAGLTVVTVNPSYRPRELKYVLEQSRAAGVFIVREHRGNPMAAIAAEVAAKLPGLREVIDVEDHDALFAGASDSGGWPVVSAWDPAQIQYTSGTTGFPKGAVLPHRGLTNNSRYCLARAGMREGDTILNMMPMFHTTGCAVLALGSVQFGCRMILARMFDPQRMTAVMEAERVEMFLGVPTMLNALLDALTMQPRDVSSVRVVISGGALVPVELVRRVRAAFGCDFTTVYGQTETSPILTQTQPGDSRPDLFETVGQPVAQTDVSIRHSATNQVVPVGQVGEICARGYCLMLEYNDNPAATAAAIDGDGWLHTGDLGTMDVQGYVRVTGRVKEMIIRGGENLFPAEIENVMLEHPHVVEVAVVGIPHDHWGEVVACFVRTTAGQKLNRQVLIAHCRLHLSPQKTPAHWVEVDAWPLTGSGKIQKFILRERFEKGELRETSDEG